MNAIKVTMLKIILILIALASINGEVFPENCGHSLNNSLINWRIIGGSDAAMGEFPWFSEMTLVNSKFVGTSNFCGGAIINEKWVLTAAHCVFLLSKNDTVQVRLGLHNMTELEQSEVDINIVKVRVHRFIQKLSSIN